MSATPNDERGTGWVDGVRRAAADVRLRVLEHCLANDGGYLSQACSSAEILSTLYLRTMKLGPSVAPKVPGPFLAVPGTGAAVVSGAGYNGAGARGQDRFFLSPAHYALVLYATLIAAGRLAPEALGQFNRDGSIVEMIGAEHSPGFETMGGALAQTLSQAAGVALARARNGDPGRLWAFLSDGEFQEGQSWETIQAMAFHRIGNLVAYVDVNGHQCDGAMDEVMGIEPLDARIRAFGGTATVVDGHDPLALDAASRDGAPGVPHFVLCRTDPCRGVDLLRKRRPKFHYLRFGSAAEKAEYQALHDELARDAPLMGEGAEAWKS
jgi:transketolase